jgi:hypothetical protein
MADENETGGPSSGGSGILSEDQAAALLGGDLGNEDIADASAPPAPKAARAKAPKEPEAIEDPDDTVSDYDASGSAEHQPADAEADEEGDPEEDEDQAEEQSAPSDDDAEVFALDDGTKVSRKEAREGYLRNRDYTQKTQALGNERKSARELFQKLNEFAPAIMERLQLADALVAEYAVPRPPDPELEETDPVKYLMLERLHDKAMREFQARVHAIREGLASTQGLAGEHGQVLTAEKRQQEMSALHSAIPALFDPKTQAGTLKAIQSAAEKAGFTPQEVTDHWTDHRLHKLALLASRAVQLDQQKPKVAKKVEGKPPVAKPGTRGTEKQGAQLEYARSMQRLQRSGSIDDAAAALNAMENMRR